MKTRLLEFEENLENNRRSILNFIISKGRSYADAEDILQKASLTMWRRYDTFEHGSGFMSWACTIAQFECNNYYRRMIKCPVSFDSDIVNDLANNLTQYKEKEDPRKAKLELALKKLPKKSRSLLYSVYVEGEEIKTLAKKHGKSPRTYYNTLNLIRKSLLDLLS
jgi:RNA polymerase sigma-70 factor (ECF subfamily)